MFKVCFLLLKGFIFKTLKLVKEQNIKLNCSIWEQKVLIYSILLFYLSQNNAIFYYK